MSVTTQSYTTNSKKIIISNEFGNGSTNVISAVDSAITGQGWTLYDTINTTLFNPIVTKVYRVLNYDGITYKYLIIRWDTVKQLFWTSTCYSWSTSTKLPTYESFNAAGGFAQGYDIANSYIIVSATARHVMIWPFINGQPGLWTAVVEFERVATEDTTTLANPCFAWTNSLMIGTPWGRPTAGQSPTMFAFPYTFDGSTGALAASIYAPVTNRGMLPPQPIQANITYTDPTVGNSGHMAVYGYNLTYGWNFQGSTTSTISIDTGTLYPVATPSYQWFMPMGRMYDFGVTRPYGNPGDTTSANLDPTFGWPASTGTPAEAFLMPMNGGWEGTAAYAPGQFSYNYANIGPSVIPMKAVGVGDNIFVAMGNTTTGSGGIATVSYTGGIQQPPVFRANITGGVYDILFDGNGYIWGTTSNGVVQMNANTFSSVYFTSNQTIANGGAYLGIDNKNVYMSNRLANTTPQIYTIDRATGNVYFGNTYNTVSAFTSASGWGTPIPDYTGNVFAFQTAGVATAQTIWMGKFLANTGANLAYTQGNTGFTGQAHEGHSGYYDPISNRLWEIAPAAGGANFVTYEYYSANLIQTGNVSNVSTGTTTLGAYQTNLYGTGTADYRGDQYVIPWRGHFMIGTKKPGLVNANVSFSATGLAAFSSLWSFANIGAQANVNVNAQTNTIVYSPTGGSGWSTTNGSTIYSVYSGSAPANDNRVMIINGLYGVNNTSGGASSRLLLKA